MHATAPRRGTRDLVTTSEPLFSPLPPAALTALDRQRAFVADLVRSHVPGATLSRAPTDFAVVQRIIDAGVLAPTQTWELQALGVVFGDALAGAIAGLAWCQVTDAYGTDPTLRFGATSVQVNVLTMIAKRVESGQAVDVQKLAERVTEFLRTQASERA